MGCIAKFRLNSKYVRSALEYVYPWLPDFDAKAIEFLWRVQPWREPGKVLSNMGILQEHERVFICWPEQLHFYSSCCHRGVCVKKFTYFVVTSNFLHSVYWPTFSGVITTKRFLCVTRLDWSAVKTPLGCNKLFTQFYLLALRWHKNVFTELFKER